MTALALALTAPGCSSDRGEIRPLGGGKADDPAPDRDFDPAVADAIGDLFEQIIRFRHPPGTTDVKRAVFLKPHGCAKATFEIAADLPETHRVGLFSEPGVHQAWVRISSDTVPQTSDFNNNTIGFAVKVLGVPGEKVLPGEESFETHDFLTQNHPVFFVDTAQDFLDFTLAIFAGKTDDYLAEHPRTDEILEAMAKPVSNVLASSYWSTTPYQFGEDGHAKYKVIPCGDIPSEEEPAMDEPNYLRKRLERDVLAQGACFSLQVQRRLPEDVADMPLDRATVEWDEELSPPVTVATITIEPQDIAVHDVDCENMSFTAWHALPAHRPVGSVNEARGIVYKRLADLRRTRNGVPIAEPTPDPDPEPEPQPEPQ